MFGLSIEGPGKRTAEPVPDDMTRNPALLHGSGEHERRVYGAQVED